ncbi:protein-glutamate O-methyltransferase CheR [Polyangium sp. 15x6]|uniref:CheR family methyltransferase n=1 Tax=Polyangium sp. 15x6 TaxID=3042687 RepID=UPI002499E6FA|nr:protein-glutamate O-methyltransferase CheR [Polyangium sp. 15x6]MDI3288922.1 protein-glutamate O-methyltransferase CheR [Polyangium sp. 15x6]
MRFPDEIRLAPDEFRLLRDLINQHCGISLSPEQRPVIERRLRERLSVHGLHSFGEYYQLLRSPDRGRAELDEALDLVTINETYFYREDYQLTALRTELFPMLRRPPLSRESLSIWSAGCSTGEEVYSIAITAKEAGLSGRRDLRIFGSDISRRCVAHARRGVYGSSSFRAIPLDLKRKYFIEKPDGMHVQDDLRAWCHFGHLNLLDPVRASVVGRVDIIFCRNVLIYFDDASRRRVIDMFYDRLLPGGFLLLGHSESLLNVSTAFELVHLRDDLVYRKPITTSRFAPQGLEGGAHGSGKP